MTTATGRPVVRLLHDEEVGAADGLALDEALMASVGRRAAEPIPTLRLYTYRSHCALVGRYQSLSAEIDIDRCVATGTEFGRRPTGGGAIVMGRDQLGVALVVPAPPRTPQQLIRHWAAGVQQGLALLGIRAEFGGKNDLLVDGRKIAGLGVYTDGDGAALFHASVLADLDVRTMLDVLRIPAAKLERHGVTAVQQRITTVTRETGIATDADGLRASIAAGFASALGVDLVPGTVTADETERAAELAETVYRSDSWLFPADTARDGTGSATFRSPEGQVRVFLAVRESLVKSALFTGDFTAPPPALTALEAALRWERLDRKHVTRAVVAVRERYDPAWDDDDVVVTALLTAGERARTHAAAHPARTGGSCYFPEVG
ncbi:MAG: biotin/lipoate A/B protein ligase family protein [Candidatus Nanopelagicales bacterium]